jgi:hypothetical protein
MQTTANWAKDDSSALDTLVELHESIHELTIHDTLPTTFSKSETAANNLTIKIEFTLSTQLSEIQVQSTARIIEIYANENCEYIGTFKHEERLADHNYLCTATFKKAVQSLAIKFLSNNHPQSKNQVDVYAISLVGQATSETQASEAYEKLMKDPSMLMSMLSNIGGGSSITNMTQSLQVPQTLDDFDDLIERKIESILEDVVKRVVDDRLTEWEEKVLKEVEERILKKMQEK